MYKRYDEVTRHLMQLQHVTETLGGLGLTDKESSVYLSLIARGGMGSTIEVARSTGLPRTSVYDILVALQQKGILVEKKRKNTKVFSVESPAHLLAYLRQQETALATTKYKLTQTVADLEAMLHPRQLAPSLRHFQGEEGLLRMWEEQIHMTASQGGAFSVFCTEPFFQHFQTWLKDKSTELRPRGIAVKVLVSSPSDEPIFIKIRNFEVKATKHAYAFASGLNVLGNFVGLWTEMDSMSGMLLENEHFARMHETLFEQAWSLSDFTA